MGDVNGDGRVGRGDAAQLASNFGLAVNEHRGLGDLDRDSRITLFDLALLQASLGDAPPPFATPAAIFARTANSPSASSPNSTATDAVFGRVERQGQQEPRALRAIPRSSRHNSTDYDTPSKAHDDLSSRLLRAYRSRLRAPPYLSIDTP